MKAAKQIFNAYWHWTTIIHTTVQKINGYGRRAFGTKLHIFVWPCFV